jgi:hypothetical protein
VQNAFEINQFFPWAVNQDAPTRKSSITSAGYELKQVSVAITPMMPANLIDFNAATSGRNANQKIDQ